MNTQKAKQMLTEKRNWWEPIVEHEAEHATMDPQSNFTFRLALQKVAALKRNEKRIALGIFGRCERCSKMIGDDRLETILDSEWHYCAECASKPAPSVGVWKASGQAHSSYGYEQSAA